MLELYRNIRSRRNELHLTQTELAKRLGYADKSMISKIEKGEIDLQISRIMDIAKALEIKPAVLVGWIDA